MVDDRLSSYIKKKKTQEEEEEKIDEDDDDGNEVEDDVIVRSKRVQDLRARSLVNVLAVCRPGRPCKPEKTGPPRGIFKTATLRPVSTDCTR